MLSKLNQYSSRFHELKYKAKNDNVHESLAVESISAVAQILMALDLVKETDKRKKLEEKSIKRYPLLPYLTCGYTNSETLTKAINHYIK